MIRSACRLNEADHPDPAVSPAAARRNDLGAMRRFDRQAEEEIVTRVTALGTIGSVLDVLRCYEARDEAIDRLEQDVARQRAACVDALRGRLRTAGKTASPTRR
jgi:hypothetical protein